MSRTADKFSQLVGSFLCILVSSPKIPFDFHQNFHSPQCLPSWGRGESRNKACRLPATYLTSVAILSHNLCDIHPEDLCKGCCFRFFWLERCSDLRDQRNYIHTSLNLHPCRSYSNKKFGIAQQYMAQNMVVIYGIKRMEAIEEKGGERGGGATKYILSKIITIHVPYSWHNGQLHILGDIGLVELVEILDPFCFYLRRDNHTGVKLQIYYFYEKLTYL